MAVAANAAQSGAAMSLEIETTASLVARYLAHVAAARAELPFATNDATVRMARFHAHMARGLAKDIAARRAAGDVLAAGVIGCPHFLTHNGEEI